MRVGKSGIFTCDFCGRSISDDPDTVRKEKQEYHFCKGRCLDEYLFETHCQEKIQTEVESRVREEFNLIHKQVCPACKYRLQKLV